MTSMRVTTGRDVLALDFDGVISDSAPESFVVAIRTATALANESVAGKAPRSAQASEELAALDPVQVAEHPLYQCFLPLMPLGNRAEDFGVALRALEDEVALADQVAYDQYRGELGSEFLGCFHERFYGERASLRESEPDGWRRLLGPYPDFVEVVRTGPHPVELAIATAKDRPSVLQLLSDYGIASAFPQSRVFDKETGVSKRAHLARIRDEVGCGYAEITFVDDKLNHLEDVAPLGVRPVLAAWGYNGERERARACALGIEVCELSQIREVLFRS